MKIIKLIYSLVFCFCYFISFSQTIFINVKAPTSATFSSADVWNFDVINSSGPEFKARFEATISNNQNGTLVELSSNPVTVPIGIGSFSPAIIQTKNVKYFNSALADLERNTNSLPSGNYLICIRMICMDEICGNLNREGGSYCVETNIIESSPLLLNSPADKDSIEETNPYLTWIPPMPIGSSPDINYSVELFPVKGNQSLSDAISRNRAIFKQKEVQGNSLPYPNGIEPLKEGETYTWHVDAWLKGMKIATSEVWQFKVKKTIPKNLDTFRYAELIAKPDGGFITLSNQTVLYFTFKGDYANEDLNLELNSDDGRPVKINQNELLKNNISRPDESIYLLKSFGENKYELNLSRFTMKPGFYMIKVKTTNYKEYYLKINIK